MLGNSIENKTSARPSIVHIGDVSIGGLRKTLMCGPCAIESEDQIERTAEFLSEIGIPIIRGGAFKFRTDPRSFQGLGHEGLDLLSRAARRHGLLVISEIMDPRELEFFLDRVDILQIGARNMQNTPLLREVGRSGRPVLLKRGCMATIEEMLLATEYVLQEGNSQIILCERGVRTFEPLTRNTLDLACVALVKQMSALPIIVDLSHALGRTDIMTPLAKAALVCGCDGLMIEIHPCPVEALSDGRQSLSFQELANLMLDIDPILHYVEGTGTRVREG